MLIDIENDPNMGIRFDGGCGGGDDTVSTGTCTGSVPVIERLHL